MTTAAEEAVIKSGKLSLDKPKDKGAKGWNVIGSLVSLGPSKDCKKFGAKVSLVVATWPGKRSRQCPAAKPRSPRNRAARSRPAMSMRSPRAPSPRLSENGALTSRTELCYTVNAILRTSSSVCARPL